MQTILSFDVCFLLLLSQSQWVYPQKSNSGQTFRSKMLLLFIGQGHLSDGTSHLNDYMFRFRWISP